MKLYRLDTGWGFSIGDFLLFHWEGGTFATLDVLTGRNSYYFAYNSRRWIESDIHIKVTPPWREVQRPKRFEFKCIPM